jgi:hypothetical protein
VEHELLVHAGPGSGTTGPYQLRVATGKTVPHPALEVDHPDAPDGIAIIGYDNDKRTLLQHYFDSRGIARVYEMTFADNIWTLQRIAAAPDFSQRFTGTFDHDTIVGQWQSSSDGMNWDPDFELTYTRVQ